MKRDYQKQDFTQEGLPKTRRKQWGDIIANNWRTYLLLGSIFLLFSLPLLITIFFKDYQMMQIASSDASEESKKATMYVQLLIYSGIKVPCYILFAIPVAGAALINRELSFGEGVLFKDDFFKGIKQNVGKYLLLIGMFSILLFLAKALFLSYSFGGNRGIPPLLIGISFGVLFLFFLPLFLFQAALEPIYSLSLSYSMMNALQFALRKYGYMLLFLLPFAGGVALLFIPSSYVYIIAIVIITIASFPLPIYCLGFHLFALSIFDRYINKEHYPNLYRKGLSKEE